MFGLSGREFRTLMNIILLHAEQFERVILFGSRARGDCKTHSDIDLAIAYKNKQAFSGFQEDLDESKLPYTVDVVDLALEKETKLKSFIQNEGIILYDDAKKEIGERWMTVAILNEKLTDFKSALSRLTEALSKNIESDSLYLDGTIQRFEFTYELCWKLMKAYLNHLGVEVNNPRESIRESIKQNIIQDKPEWFQMLEKRNLTTHTYHKEIALEVYAGIKATFVYLLRDFEQKISPLIKAL